MVPSVPVDGGWPDTPGLPVKLDCEVEIPSEEQHDADRSHDRRTSHDGKGQYANGAICETSGTKNLQG
jgi:hypothetical protein